MGDHGWWALFVLMALETAMVLAFIPSELILAVAAASLARDPWTLALVVAVATLGAAAGSLMLYGAARYGGRPFLERHPRLFHLTPKRLARMEATFQRPSGQSLVFFMRLLPVVRGPISIPAGIARMGVGRFLVLSTLGCAIFNFVFCYASYESRKGGRLAQALAAWETGMAGSLLQFVDAVVHSLWFWIAAALLGFITLTLAVIHRRRVLASARRWASALAGLAAGLGLLTALAIAVGIFAFPEATTRLLGAVVGRYLSLDSDVALAAATALAALSVLAVALLLLTVKHALRPRKPMLVARKVPSSGREPLQSAGPEGP